MGEYELADITASVLSNFLTALTVFLSIVSAYVISAFSAGERFTRFQLSLINSCFLAAVSILGFLVVSLYRRFYALAHSLKIERGTLDMIDFSWPLCVLLLAIVFASFAFMWDVRQRDKH